MSSSSPTSPEALAELCGISLLERLLRTLQRLGLTKAIVSHATPELLAQHLANPSPHRAKVAIDIRRHPGGPVAAEADCRQSGLTTSELFSFFGATSVFDPRLLQLLDEPEFNRRTG